MKESQHLSVFSIKFQFIWFKDVIFHSLNTYPEFYRKKPFAWLTVLLQLITEVEMGFAKATDPTPALKTHFCRVKLEVQLLVSTIWASSSIIRTSSWIMYGVGLFFLWSTSWFWLQIHLTDSPLYRYSWIWTEKVDRPTDRGWEPYNRWSSNWFSIHRCFLDESHFEWAH